MQISLFDGNQKFKVNKPIRLIELFGGIGCQASALEKLGIKFEHYQLCEIDKYAVKSYNAIHGTSFATSDITKLKGEDLGIVETDKYDYVMTYSFPCTDLSKAGKQKGMAKGSGTRSGLLWEVERLLDESKELPQILLMENVPDVIGTKNMPHFADWISKLESLGYKNYWKVLNATEFGIPQNRKRCYMVSLLGDYYYEFPKPFPLELRLKDMLEENVDEKYYLSGKIISKFNGDFIEKGTGKHQSNSVFNEENNISRTLTATDWKSPMLIQGVCEPQNAYYYNYGESERFSKPPLKEISRTLRASNDKNAVIKDLRIRKLTPKECWRLMGLTDEQFDKAKARGVSNSQLYKQAGNGIVVNVLMAIFKNLF